MIIRGKDIKVYINTGTEDTPVWAKLKYEREASLSIDLDTIDITNKDSGSWEEGIASHSKFSVKVSGIQATDCPAFAKIRNVAFTEDPDEKKIQFKYDVPKLGYFIGYGIPKIDTDGGYKDTAKYSITISPEQGGLSFTAYA